jgi:radical SAM superfamily enzyme YgiQ (UPF0313 family)
LGLLLLAALLRRHGYRVSYIDCLNRFHPKVSPADHRLRHGRGPYLKAAIPRPAGLKDVDRSYSRYGIPPGWFLEDLRSIDRPDLILVTSQMTYWYPGVQEAVTCIREVFADVPLVLGGIYATLCRRHAERLAGVDRIVAGSGESVVLDLAGETTGFRPSLKFDPEDLDSFPWPALDLQTYTGYAPLLTSMGCSLDCAYCASRLLAPRRKVRSTASVLEEIRFWHQNHGVIDFVFYDDALLLDASAHAVPLLEGIARAGLKVRFHTPNALHIRWISRKVAELMHRVGFETVRLGLETAGFSNVDRFDAKVTAAEFRRAVLELKRAGFRNDQIGAYLLAGLPGQSMETIAASIRTVKEAGITPVPTYYSPIPGTSLWPKAVSASRYDLEADPVFTNNAVLPCSREPFSWQWISRIKQLATG